jgi:hypothetical protein
VSVGVEVVGRVGVSDGLDVGDNASDVRTRIFGVEETSIVEFGVLTKEPGGVLELQEIIRKTTNTQTICNCTAKDMNLLFIFLTNSYMNYLPFKAASIAF